MSGLLRTLLDIDELDPSGEGVRVTFERAVPGWGWLLVGLGALALAWWSYRRLQGSRVGRGALACVRVALLVFLVLLVSGPQLSQRSEAVERDWVLVLVDRSASLSVPDGEGGASGRVAREAELRAAIQDSWGGWRELSSKRTVVWLGFDGGTFELAVRGERGDSGEATGRIESVDLGDADGGRTALGRSLDQALARAAGRPLAAVVVVSDGRSVDAVSRAAVRRLKGDRVPVHTVALGSATPIGDLAVRRVEAPELAFVNDGVPVRVRVERNGGAGRVSGVVQLVDEATGDVLDEELVSFGEDGETTADVLLSHREGIAGDRAWSVRVVPDGVDLIADNNERSFELAFTGRPLRVLYIDGYARWEQRYLRNLLIREPSVVSSSLLLSPNRRYTQEGNIALTALPDSPEMWAEYDVIVLGDVMPDVFTRAQIEQIRDHVALAGGGLVWIGGPGATPSAWWNTALADVLPMARSGDAGRDLGVPAVAVATPAASRLGVLRLASETELDGWPAFLSDASLGWPRLQWVQEINPRGLKPTVEVLATARGVGGGSEHPLVMTMRFGAGRVLYVATDEVWRWRYARGEQLFERFWLQLLRMLGRESLERGGRDYVVSVSPKQAEVEQPVRVAVELIDQSLIDERLPSIDVRLVRDGDEGGSVELELQAEDATRRVYSTVWLPTGAGEWGVELTDRGRFGGGEVATFEVIVADDELRFAEADHAVLREVSAATGGLALSASEIGEVFGAVPNRSIRLVNERAEPLWDTPLALVVFLILVTLEWVGRRLVRLI